MKLISMTDFVLDHKHMILGNSDKYIRVSKYAKFLKQPLKLEMFIPCDEKGIFLEEPQMRPERNSFDEEDMEYDAQELTEYIKAKEKVLFKGFRPCITNRILSVEHDKTSVFFQLKEVKDVESITDSGLIELTESAIKKLGL